MLSLKDNMLSFTMKLYEKKIHCLLFCLKIPLVVRLKVVASFFLLLKPFLVKVIFLPYESPPIPFAVELGCEVVKSNDSTYLKPHRVEIVNGEINFLRIHRETTFYRIQNKSDNKLDFLLNHIFLEDYDLVQNPNVEEEEPVDITDRFYLFRFHVEP